MTHRSHKQYNFVQRRPKSKPKCHQFSRYLESSHEKEKYFIETENVSFRVSIQPPTMAMLQPQMKAPEFKGTAVVNGEFKEVKIDFLPSSFFQNIVFL